MFLVIHIHCMLLLLVIAGVVAVAWQPDNTVNAAPSQHPGGKDKIS